VEKGTTTCDFEPEEISRQLSISTALAPFTVNGVKVNLLDTPGYADFASEMLTALASSDLAVVVVSATDGVQAQTEDAWRAAAKLGLPRVIVINKLDRERADFDRTLAEIRASSGPGWRRWSCPSGRGRLPRGHRPAGRHGHPLRHPGAEHAGRRDRPPGRATRAPSPTSWSTRSTRCTSSSSRASWWATTTSWSATSGGESIDYGELEKSLAGGVASGSVFPVLCCSGLTGVGVDRLARLIEELCPTRLGGPPSPCWPGPPPTEIPCDAEGRRAAHGDQDLHRQPHREDVAVQGDLGHADPDTVLINTRTRERGAPPRPAGPLRACHHADRPRSWPATSSPSPA
jgi:elongation factor G